MTEMRTRPPTTLIKTVARLALVLGVAHPALAQGADTLTTTASKVYAGAQAAKGRQAFQLTCLSCHKPTELSGDKFWSGVVGKSLRDFFDYLRTSMPQDNPGGLDEDDYVNLTAYILQLNGMPAGERALTADSTALAKIRVVPADTTKKGATR